MIMFFSTQELVVALWLKMSWTSTFKIQWTTTTHYKHLPHHCVMHMTHVKLASLYILDYVCQGLDIFICLNKRRVSTMTSTESWSVCQIGKKNTAHPRRHGSRQGTPLPVRGQNMCISVSTSVRTLSVLVILDVFSVSFPPCNLSIWILGLQNFVRYLWRVYFFTILVEQKHPLIDRFLSINS